MKSIRSLLSVLLATVMSAQAGDHGNTLSTATPVTQPDIPGTLQTTGDEDWFKIEVTEPGMHWFHTTGTTDTRGYLYSHAGSQLSTDNNGGDSYNFEISRALATGTYYLRIIGGTTIANTGAYTFHVRGPRFATDFTAPNISARLDTPGEIQLYRINTVAEGRHWIFSTGATDTYARLYDHGGSLLTYDDHGGTGTNFSIERVLQASRTYFLMIRSGSSVAGTGPYALSWRHAANAIHMTGTSRDLSLVVPGDLDLFAIDVPVGGGAWIYSTGSTNTYGRLYDNGWNLIGYNDNSGTNLNFEITRTLTPGRYWLGVDAGGTGGTATGPYTLHVRQWATATLLHGSGSTNRSIDPAGDQDLYVFSTSGGAVSFSSSGTTDTYGRLYGSGMNLVAYNDNSGTGLNFQINSNLVAGTYYLLVTGSGVQTGSYQLNASFPSGGTITTLSSASAAVSGSGSAAVQISSTGAWTVGGLPSWVSVSQSSGSGDADLTFTFVPNPTGSRREATVTIGGIAHVLVQNPAGNTGGVTPEPVLSIRPAVILAIETIAGSRYKIETSTDLVHWQDTGIEFTGDGHEMSAAIERTQAKAFFRAVVD